MRILLLSSATLALCIGPASAQTYRTARSEPAPAQQSAEAAPGSAATQQGARQQYRRQHARQAQQMARAHHASPQPAAGQTEAPAARRDEPLPLGDAIIVTEAPEPDAQ